MLIVVLIANVCFVTKLDQFSGSRPECRGFEPPLWPRQLSSRIGRPSDQQSDGHILRDTKRTFG